MRHFKWLALIGVLASAGSVHAQGSLGGSEYAASCAACHGAEGAGDGPMAQDLNLEIPDLRSLASRNGGQFPFLEALNIIDGREGVRLHGSAMPIWGDRFKIDALEVEVPEDAEMMVRGRLLSLLLYLESIQQ